MALAATGAPRADIVSGSPNKALPPSPASNPKTPQPPTLSCSTSGETTCLGTPAPPPRIRCPCSSCGLHPRQAPGVAPPRGAKREEEQREKFEWRRGGAASPERPSPPQHLRQPPPPPRSRGNRNDYNEAVRDAVSGCPHRGMLHHARTLPCTPADTPCGCPHKATTSALPHSAQWELSWQQTLCDSGLGVDNPRGGLFLPLFLLLMAEVERRHGSDTVWNGEESKWRLDQSGLGRSQANRVQDDWVRYAKMTEEIGEQLHIVGDDLVTNPTMSCDLLPPQSLASHPIGLARAIHACLRASVRSVASRRSPRHLGTSPRMTSHADDNTTRPTAGAEGREDEDVQHHRPFITGFAITGFIVIKMTTNFTEEDLKNSNKKQQKKDARKAEKAETVAQPQQQHLFNTEDLFAANYGDVTVEGGCRMSVAYVAPTKSSYAMSHPEGPCDPIAPLDLPHFLQSFHRVSACDSIWKDTSIPHILWRILELF
uniref:Phosphopyruvate hydratase n=1 Tax=Zea mays TaxID=4577 RepID=A0A804QTJ6_MAIZE